MKLIILTHFVICIFSLLTFAQSKAAVKIFNIGEMVDGDLKNHVLQIREGELRKSLKSKLYIVKYGSMQMVARRLRQLNKAIDFLRIDRTRFEIAAPIPNPFLMTEFWIVPEKAENPNPSKYSEKFSEIGLATDGMVKIRIKQFFERMEKTPNSIAYFLNYGSAKQKAIRVKQINKSINFLMHDMFRLILVDGGYSKTLKTELWISNPRENNK
jgi:hypothetical protein